MSNAGGLYTITSTHETDAYNHGKNLIVVGIVFSILIGVIDLLLLALTAGRLAGFTHRYVNIGLTAGAALMLVVLVAAAVQFHGLDVDFTTVGHDSLIPIEAALTSRPLPT